MPHPIILHHFDRSPFSEKIRVVFGHKRLSWRSVRIPEIMPKPDLMPLTGGYRRTPVMQIGADVFCDTQIIIREIERRFPSPTLFPPGAAGVAWGLSSWTDRAFFQAAVNLVFGTLGPKVPQAFVEDRSQLRGAKFDLDKMRAAIPQMRDQLRAQLGWIEAQLSDGRKWLLGEFGLADVSAYMNVWYVRSNLTAEEDQAVAGVDKIFAALKQVAAWETACERSDTGAARKCPPMTPSQSRQRRTPKLSPRMIPTMRTDGKWATRRASCPMTTERSRSAERSFLSRRSTSPYAAWTNASAKSWSISRARVFSFSRAEGLSVLPGRSDAAKGA